MYRFPMYSDAMPKRDEAGPRDGGELAGFGRHAGTGTLILSSLADGPKHGYALTKDVEEFAGVLFVAWQARAATFQASATASSSRCLCSSAAPEMRRTWN
jgi:hypothetical protein